MTDQDVPYYLWLKLKLQCHFAIIFFLNSILLEAKIVIVPRIFKWPEKGLYFN